MAKKTPAGVVPSDDAVKLFGNILQNSYARIFDTFSSNTLATNKRRKAAMQQIEAIAAETGLDLKAWVNVEVRAMYENGMFDSMKTMADADVPVKID